MLPKVITYLGCPEIKQWAIDRIKQSVTNTTLALVWGCEPNIYPAVATLEGRRFPIINISYPSNSPILFEQNRAQLWDFMQTAYLITGIIHLRAWGVDRDEIWTLEPTGLISQVSKEGL